METRFSRIHSWVYRCFHLDTLIVDQLLKNRIWNFAKRLKTSIS